MPEFKFTDKHVEKVIRNRKKRHEKGPVPIPDFLREECKGKEEEEKYIILMGWNIWYFLARVLKKELKNKFPGKRLTLPDSGAHFLLSHKKGVFTLKIIDPKSAELLNMPQEIKIETRSPSEAYCKFMAQYAGLSK